MILPEEEEDILREASVPEHIVRLMVAVSKGEPYLASSYYREHKIDYILNLLKLSLRARRAWQSHSLGLLRRPAKRRTPRNDPVRLMETILCSK